jgi:cytochrome c-type biogenesis protein CcmH/NrfG
MSDPVAPPLNPQAISDWAELSEVYRQSLVLRPTDAQIWCKLGVALSRLGDEPGAAHAFAEAIKQKPDEAWGWYFRSVQALFAGQMVEALQAQDKARKLAANIATQSVWTELNLSFCSHSTTAELIASCRGILALDSNNADIWERLGAALGRQGHHPESIDAFHQAVALRPEDSRHWKVLIDALWQPEDLPAKISIWRRYLKVFPEDAAGWTKYGLALSAQRECSEAVAAFRRAVEIDPKRAESWNLLAEAFRQKGDPAGEIVAYRQFLQLQPEADAPNQQLELF